jgi:DNA polymerase-3 subunit alpha
MTVDGALKISPQLKELYNNDERIKKLLDTARALEGMPRHASTHAAGVVITQLPVSDYVPLAVNGESVVTQVTMVTLEELGLLKMDFLGLRNLTVIDSAAHMVKSRDPEFDINKIDLNDDDTYKMLASGDTLGVFQLESAGMTSVVTALMPHAIEEITAVVALYRPGPMDSIPKYVESKHHPEKELTVTRCSRTSSKSPTAVLSIRNRSWMYSESSQASHSAERISSAGR